MIGWDKMPFEISDYENPKTVRFRKYSTGAHLLLEAHPPQTGRTPREVVWRRGKARLYRYAPGQQKEHAVPVLLVYALILRPYILDLVPNNSLVEQLLGEGFDVYMLDWGVPGDDDKDLTFENYVLDCLPEAVENVLRGSRAEELTLFGYCQGGTIAAMYASLLSRTSAARVCGGVVHRSGYPGCILRNIILDRRDSCLRASHGWASSKGRLVTQETSQQGDSTSVARHDLEEGIR